MYEGFILQPTYRVRGERAVIQLYGRLSSGEAFLVEEDRYKPYFFIRAQDLPLLSSEQRAAADFDAEPLRSFAGEEVTRVTVALPSALVPLRDALVEHGVPCFEADLRFPYRFLSDRGLRSRVRIEGEPKRERDGLLRFSNVPLAASQCEVELRSLSLDIETSGTHDQVLSIALAGCGIEEVLVATDARLKDAAHTSYPHESALLAAFEERLLELDPDILLGWNVVDFDLRVLARRAEVNGRALSLGRSQGRLNLRQDPGFTRQWRADLPGRMVLDGLPLVRDALRLEDYRLETVAREVLGRGKLIAQDGRSKVAEIERLHREDPDALAAYNLEDARLVNEILEREGLLALAIERSLLSGMQLDRIGASIASFDLVFLPELRKRGYVAPSVDRERKSQAIRGGSVLDSQPGLFRNVAVFDFKSLYPSLISTFQLCPLAHAHAKSGDESDAILAPNGARFSRHESILPAVIDTFRDRRDAAKARGDRNADQAIKIMMNAFFGVLGSASCRFFDPEVANAITSFGQQTLEWTREIFEGMGREVIYGDTDSVFVHLDEGASRSAAAQEARALRERASSAVAERIRSEYALEPQLLLELERVYDRFFMPRVRSGSSGSKKRYAGWLDGQLEVVGLEAVRRDWPAIARRLQRGLLEHLFRDEDPLPFAREIASAVRLGTHDTELVYVKRLRKGSMKGYASTSPPHVQAAIKAGLSAGEVVRYVVTTAGPEPVSDDSPMPRDIDRRHYLERVLRPVADAILTEIDTSLGDAIGEPRQLALL